jgi:hypothetical protein
MKNLKLLTLATLLGLVLVFGQGHAVVASPITGVSGTISPANFDSTTPDFGVEILSVGPDSYTTVDVSSDGTYHMELASVGFTVIRLNATISGYNLWTDYQLGNATFPGLFDVPIVGEVYTVVNGEIITTQAAVNGITGFDVVLSAEVNVISLIYIGRAEDGSITWDADTVTVRLGSDLTKLANNPFTAVEVPATLSFTDKASTVDTKDITGILSANYYYGINIEQLFEPTQDLTVKYDGKVDDTVAVSDGELEVQDVSTSDSIVISGTVDSSGFVGQPYYENFNFSAWLDYWYYLDDTWPLYTEDTFTNATAGITLFQDTTGVHLPSDVDSVTLYYTPNIGYSQSEFTVITFAPYGDWDIYTDFVGSSGGDPNGQFSSSTLSSSAANLTVPVKYSHVYNISGYGGGVFGANEWTVSTFGVKVTTVVSSLIQTTTITESPGFSIAMAMTGVAVIAYVTPKLRKE